jgi:hypothetical protein
MDDPEIHSAAFFAEKRFSAELSPQRGRVFTAASHEQQRIDGPSTADNLFRHREIPEKSVPRRMSTSRQRGFPQFFPQLWKTRVQTASYD